MIKNITIFLILGFITGFFIFSIPDNENNPLSFGTAPRILTVLQGGTGTSTITSAGVIFGSGTSPIRATAPCSNGQIIKYSGGVPACGTDTTGAGGGSFAWTVRSYGVSTSTTLGFLAGFLSTASSTINANATTTGSHTFGSIIEPTLTSALIQAQANGLFVEYGGTTCTNQFVRALSALGIATCATVSLTADVTGTLPEANGGTGDTDLDDILGTSKQITVTDGANTIIGGNATLSLPSHVQLTSLFATNASSTNATTTSLQVTNNINFDSVVGNQWSDFCVSITGGAGLCDGTDATGGGGTFSWIDAPSIGASAVSTSTLLGFFGGFVSTASSTVGNGTVTGGLTVNGRATTTSLKITDRIILNNDQITDFTGTGLVISGTSLTASLGTDIVATELAVADFGDWTCNGTTCSLDADTVSDSEIDYATVTLADFDIDDFTGDTGDDDDLDVAVGGTGVSTLTDGGVLVGNGASDITALTVGTNGQLLIGSTGVDPVFATLNCADGLTCTTGAGTLEIDFDGGDTPAGVLGGTWASPTLDDNYLLNTGDTGTGDYTLDTPTFVLDSTGNEVSIGTTTQAYPLTVFASTESQLALSSGAGIAQWALRNAGGNLYFSTTTVAGTATSTRASVEFRNSGVGLAVGTTTPRFRFVVHGTDNSTVSELHIPASQAGITATDIYQVFTSTSGTEGSIAGTAVAGVIAYNTFTAQHWTHVIGDVPEILDLLRIHEGGDAPVKGKDQLFNTEIACEPKDKSVMGVYGGKNAEGLDGVIAIGTAYVKVTNKGKSIEAGDLLTSSDECGLAMLQKKNIFQFLLSWRVRDDVIRSYTVAQATESVVWKKGEEWRQISVILKK